VHSERNEIVNRLAVSRSELLETCRELDRDTWTQPVYAHGEENEWSAMDLLRHLVWAEGGMLRLMKQIRAGEEGVPADFDLDRYNASGVRKLKEETPAELLLRLEQNRKDVLAFMDTLEEGDWEKKGRHGSLRIMTIREILQLIASHEEQHLADLRRVLP
jgi:uncharacterized damage-inducible protein DinB